MVIKYFEIIGIKSITVSNVDNYISQQLYTIFDSVSNKKIHIPVLNVYLHKLKFLN